MDTFTEEQIRSFRPVIVFHDSPSTQSTLYSKAANKDSLVETHKQRINDMLEANSKIWTNLINDTRQWETAPQSTFRPVDELPAISPTASTSTSSSSSGSSTSSSSLSSISSVIQSSSSSSSFSSLPSINKGHQPQSHWKRQEYHQPLHMSPSFIGSALSLEQQDMQHRQFQQQQDQQLHYQMHMDTLCLDHMDKRRRGNLPKPVTAILKKWLLEHCQNPYPTEEEKLQLKNDTHLTLNQISNWFINARRRTLPIILAKLNHQYPGIKARRRRRRQRQNKPKRDNHSLNMTSPAEHHLG